MLSEASNSTSNTAKRDAFLNLLTETDRQTGRQMGGRHSLGPYPGAVPPKPSGCWLLFQFSNSFWTASIRDSHNFLAPVRPS